MEILVTLCLLAFLFAAIFQVHLNTQIQAARLGVELALSHEEIVLSTLLSRRIRSAGYNASDDWSSLRVYDHRLKRTLEQPVTITTIESSTLPASIRRRLEKNSSILLTRQLDSQHSELLSDYKQGRVLVLSDCQPLQVGQALLISHGHSSEISTIVRISHRKTETCRVILEQALLRSYPKHSAVGRFLEYTFYVAKTGRRDRLGDIYALYLKLNNEPSVALSDAVNNMRMRWVSAKNRVQDAWRLLEDSERRRLLAIRLSLRMSESHWSQIAHKKSRILIKIRNLA